MARFRYMVADAAAAASFYTENFGFRIQLQVPAISIVSRGDMTLLLSGPRSSARKPMPDGTQTDTGGWNRIMFEVDDIQTVVRKLRIVGVKFRNEIHSGPGGSQIIAEDLDGNPIEVFEAD